MRYAWNWTHHQGLVWNPNERVQGFTNPLWVLVMAVPSLVFNREGAVLAIQIVGAICMLVVAWLTSRVTDHLVDAEPDNIRRTAAIVGFTVPLLYYPLSFWCLQGMETGIVAVLAVLAVVLALQHPNRGTAWFGIVLGLLVCTRPDASIQAMLLGVFRFVTVHPAKRRAVVVEGVLALAIVLVEQCALRAYYGSWLPNTYQLKLVGYPLPLRLTNGWIFVRPFLKQLAIPLLLVTAGLFASRRQALVILIFALLVSATSYQIWVGGDPWPLWRLMAPYVPLVIVASGWGMLQIARKIRRMRRLAPIIGAVMSLTGVMITIVPFYREWIFIDAAYLVDENRKNVYIGLVLRDICTDEARLGVVAAGAIGYYSGLTVVDFLGKVDTHIANLKPNLASGFHGMSTVPGHNKYDLRYSIVTLRPDYVQTDRWADQDLSLFVAAHYQTVGRLHLLNDSPNIRWDRVAALKASRHLP